MVLVPVSASGLVLAGTREGLHKLGDRTVVWTYLAPILVESTVTYWWVYTRLTIAGMSPKATGYYLNNALYEPQEKNMPTVRTPLESPPATFDLVHGSGTSVSSCCHHKRCWFRCQAHLDDW